ncbi:hypothetical protein J6590_037071 [Homalodisca vitripennis]|nr:hypothetical protein J6590_037071 [Homalodisca vitripennis]
MIVNVNPEPHLCEETQHVLKASATAKHIVVQPRMVQRPNRVTRASIFSEIVSRHNRSTLIRWDSCVRPKGNPTARFGDVIICCDNNCCRRHLTPVLA